MPHGPLGTTGTAAANANGGGPTAPVLQGVGCVGRGGGEGGVGRLSCFITGGSLIFLLEHHAHHPTCPRSCPRCACAHVRKDVKRRRLHTARMGDRIKMVLSEVVLAELLRVDVVRAVAERNAPDAEHRPSQNARRDPANWGAALVVRCATSATHHALGASCVREWNLCSCSKHNVEGLFETAQKRRAPHRGLRRLRERTNTRRRAELIDAAHTHRLCCGSVLRSLLRC